MVIDPIWPCKEAGQLRQHLDTQWKGSREKIYGQKESHQGGETCRWTFTWALKDQRIFSKDGKNWDMGVAIFFSLTTPWYRAGNAGRWRKEISKETASEVFSELPCPPGHNDLCTCNELEFSTLEWSGGWLGWRELAWWFALGYRGSCWRCSLGYLKGRCGMNGCRDFKASFLLSETSLTVADWVLWKPSALSLHGLVSCITDVAPLTPGTPHG